MKKLLLTIALTTLFATTGSAQALRLGESIPSMDVVSAMGPELKHTKREFVCLVFVHPDSQPCVDALKEFQGVDNAMAEHMEVVMITYTERSYDSVIHSFIDNNTTIAFDNKRHTFRNFGIEYVPFGVLYCNKHRKALWFGPLSKLDTTTIKRVINNHKHL